MKDQLVRLTYEIELQPGEKLTLPATLIESVGTGHWLITVQPAERIPMSSRIAHNGFLNSFGPEDEGLYDDDPPR